MIDFHSGLHDLRDGVIDVPITDADLAMRTAPAHAIRALRFKSRYDNFSFSQRLEAAMRSHAAEYLAMVSPGVRVSQALRMFRNGYAVRSFEVLNAYNVLGSVFPAVKDIAASAEYLAFERRVMSLIDERYKAGSAVNRSLVLAALLWPTVTQLADKQALDVVLEAQGLAKADRDKTAELMRFLNLNPQYGKDAALILRALSASSKFEFSKINNLIDANYELVRKNGWAELVIPRKLHKISANNFSPNSIAIANKLIAAGYKAYIVGGAVRDIILGKAANDFDIVTSASNAEIKAVLGNAEFHAVSSGAEYDLYAVLTVKLLI